MSEGGNFEGGLPSEKESHRKKRREERLKVPEKGRREDFSPPQKKDLYALCQKPLRPSFEVSCGGSFSLKKAWFEEGRKGGIIAQEVFQTV